METTRFIRVNSKYKQPGGTSSKFYYSIGGTLANRVLDLTLVSARIPRLFGNIYYPLNELIFSIGGRLSSVYVNPGQYTAVQLASQISAVCVDTQVDCSYNVDTHRFIFTNRSDTTVLMIASSPIASYIGLTADTSLTNAPTSLPYPPTLDGPSCVYIQSDTLSMCAHCVDTPAIGTYIPLIAAVDCNVPYGFTISYECKDINSQLISYRLSQSLPNLSYFDIQLCDQYGNLLSDLPENSYVDLVFKITVDMS